MEARSVQRITGPEADSVGAEYVIARLGAEFQEGEIPGASIPVTAADLKYDMSEFVASLPEESTED